MSILALSGIEAAILIGLAGAAAATALAGRERPAPRPVRVKDDAPRTPRRDDR